MAIAQGTTPTHTFTLPIDSSLLKTIHISYSQLGEIVFIKKDEDVQKSGNTVYTKLTQKDTLSLDPDELVKIELRMLTHAGDALKSEPVLRSVEECTEKEVLT